MPDDNPFAIPPDRLAVWSDHLPDRRWTVNRPWREPESISEDEWAMWTLQIMTGRAPTGLTSAFRRAAFDRLRADIERHIEAGHALDLPAGTPKPEFPGAS